MISNQIPKDFLSISYRFTEEANKFPHNSAKQAKFFWRLAYYNLPQQKRMMRMQFARGPPGKEKARNQKEII